MFQKDDHAVEVIVHFKQMLSGLFVELISLKLDIEYPFHLYKMITHIHHLTDLNKSLGHCPC